MILNTQKMWGWIWIGMLTSWFLCVGNHYSFHSFPIPNHGGEISTGISTPAKPYSFQRVRHLGHRANCGTMISMHPFFHNRKQTATKGRYNIEDGGACA